jgi:hypothetical protein
LYEVDDESNLKCVEQRAEAWSKSEWYPQQQDKERNDNENGAEVETSEP